MGKERFSERQTAVLNAAARLDEVAALPQTDIVRDAAIQRFEFTFELVWKTLQLYLEHEGFESGSPRAVLKRAFAIRLITDQDEADVWLQMLDDRNPHQPCLRRDAGRSHLHPHCPRLCAATCPNGAEDSNSRVGLSHATWTP